jgi:hypothetical protein
MMMRYLISILCWAVVLHAGAQTTEVSPPGGISRLAIYYFKINFSKEQRALLEQTELEFIYSVDERGKPTLEKVNGITDPAIIDSLIRQTLIIPYFNPKLIDGKAEASVYFMKLKFPHYGSQESIMLGNEFLTFRKLKLDDFESIEYRGEMDILIGGMMNTFNGTAQEYLGTGGGMKIEMLFTGKKNWGGGLAMDFYGNKLKQPYPIASTREQAKAPPTLLIGGFLSKKFNQEQGDNEIIFQLDANMALQNVVYREDNNDDGYVQFFGFSPALVVHYNIAVGRIRPSFYYFKPAMNRSFVNMNMALRPLFYDNKAANGVMLEFGLSWRLRTRFIESYQLK